MRIGIDAHNLEGERTGVGRYLVNILKHWVRMAPHDAEVFLYFKREIPQFPELAEARFVSRLLTPWWGKQSMAAFTHILLPRAAMQDKIDILWCPAYVAPIFWRGKLALTLHDIIFSAQPRLYDWPSVTDHFLLAWMAHHSARKAHRIFVPSLFTKTEIGRVYDILPERITVTPLAADDRLAARSSPEEVLRVKERYRISGRYFLFYGSIFRRRHIPECVAAILKVRKDFPDVEFFVGGADHSGQDVPRVIEKHNKELGGVTLHYTAFIDPTDLPALLEGATALLWLSEYEGFGLPVLEAMRAGTAVITSRTASLPEVAGECARYVENPADIQEIEAAMRSILSDSELQHRIGQCGFERARQFSWERCAWQTLAVLLALRNK